MEYFATSKFIKQGSAMVIKFAVESKKIDEMSHKESFREFIAKESNIIYCISKLLHVDSSQVERMKPIQDNKGFSFVFIIHSDAMHHNFISKTIRKAANNGTLAKVKN